MFLQLPLAIKQFSFRLISLFALLFILTFPFTLNYIPNIPAFLAPLFGEWARWTALHILGLSISNTYLLLSDSTGLHIHLLHIFLLALAGSFLWGLRDKNTNYQHLHYWFNTLVAYYLSLQLFIYGFNKIFKWQFYLPEPNTLFTPLGQTHQDLLFWSTMGSSYSYTVFSGVIEVIPAFMLLFKRTRLLGAIIACGVMVNVVAINFSFDISVKVFSLFLLLLCVIIILPYTKPLTQLFIYQQKTELKLWQPAYAPRQNKIYVFAKAALIVVLLFDVLSPYFISQNFNDDAQQRPPLHGAYTTTLFIKNGDTLAPLLTDKKYIKKVFINRAGYFITQTVNDVMMDYKLSYEAGNNLQLNNYYTNTSSSLFYTKITDSTLQFEGILDNDTILIKTQKINLQKSPLLQKEFNWTIDGY